MPKITPIHLKFTSSLHVGNRGIALEEARATIPADTLFAALVSTTREVNGLTPHDFAAPFVQNPPDPPFLLTSAFPFAGNVRFFPAPVDLIQRFNKSTRMERGKAIKRIAWISEALISKLLDGEAPDAWLFPDDAYAEPKKGVALQGGTLWLTVDEVAKLPQWMITVQKDGSKEPRSLRALRNLKVFSTERVPRVTIDRVTDGSTIFHAGRTTFAQDCGLWLGVQWLRPQLRVGNSNMTYQQAFDILLQMLADSGMGGERSSGYGAFEIAKNDSTLTLPDPTPGKPAYLLSRYHPREDELPGVLQGAGAAYRLESIAGWLYSPDDVGQRRKRLYLLEEGSHILWPGAAAGSVEDVRPEYGAPHPQQKINFPHPVWRYGLALAAGTKEASNA